MICPSALQTVLNTGRTLGQTTGASYTVSLVGGTHLQIDCGSLGDAFWIYAEDDLTSPWTSWNSWPGATALPSDLASANAILGFTLPLPSFSYTVSTYVCSDCDVRRYRNLYMSNCTEFKVLAPSGARHCIRRIPVGNEIHGSIISLQGSQDDSIPAGNLSLKTLTFSLEDVAGRLIDLAGSYFSFSLVFYG